MASLGAHKDEGLLPHVLGGVAGRAAAEAFKSPFDLLKVRLQHDTKLKARAAPIQLLILLREDHIRAWRGLPPRLIWSAPLAAITFGYFKVLKTESSEKGLSWSTIIFGPWVLAFSVAIRTPFDIIEQRKQLSTTGTASTPREIFGQIQTTWRKEGVRGTWRGYQAALLGNTSYVGGYFLLYEGARRWLETYDALSAYPTAVHLLAGGFGGGLTATLATPFDTIKVRIQTQVYATAAAPDPSLVHVVRSTIRDAGWSGLWRGATHRALSNAPSGAIMFAVYESVSTWAARRERDQEVSVR